ncbi:hypothetical protein [Allochromatium tepidum]|uniref:Uncharacterized protein n=1 Tax=Allochromatium tepidum TaxID=553982 RepID=A0ABN6GB07_9GAMM|nr:hypothetical protein [Allochromatium tepidum]BCU07095.1 hypothetical protein Atep_17720 [Allochromatium tepidum]
MSSVTPDLVPPAAPLVPVFPLAGPVGPLALYPGLEGEVRVRWRLRADEVAGHGARFPHADGAPQAVLRLGRVHAGGCEPVREQTLHLSGLSGSGEIAFPVGDDCALFEAELGLMNPEGGWLLLARSNRLRQARGLGLESLRPAPPGMDWNHAASPEPDVRAGAAAVQPLPPPHPAGGAGETIPGTFGSPLEDSTSVGGAPQVAVDSISTPVAGVPFETGPSVPAIAALMHAIPRLTYADPAPATAGLVIEAELRLHGWSTPNTEIDLFGHRYRVGPGGRFQLGVRVDDPELIRRALARHPPPESDDSR